MIEQYVTVDPIHAKDVAVGFFAALALKRGRVQAILDKFLPTES